MSEPTPDVSDLARELTSVRDWPQLQGCLRALRDRAGQPSIRELALRARKDNLHSLTKSNIGTLLQEGKPPGTRVRFENFLHVCGLKTRASRKAWIQAWDRVASQDIPGQQDSPPPVADLCSELDLVAQARQEAERIVQEARDSAQQIRDQLVEQMSQALAQALREGRQDSAEERITALEKDNRDLRAQLQQYSEVDTLRENLRAAAAAVEAERAQLQLAREKLKASQLEYDVEAARLQRERAAAADQVQQQVKQALHRLQETVVRKAQEEAQRKVQQYETAAAQLAATGEHLSKTNTQLQEQLDRALLELDFLKASLPTAAPIERVPGLEEPPANPKYKGKRRRTRKTKEPDAVPAEEIGPLPADLLLPASRQPLDISENAEFWTDGTQVPEEDDLDFWSDMNAGVRPGRQPENSGNGWVYE